MRTTIDPALQESAVAALGGLFGGVAVLDARTGEVRALAGIAYSAPQPPGSTFKIVTTTGALDAGIVSLSDEFPVEISNSDIGREIANSHDSPCGGTFAQAFANSCNTVFAPLGSELGGEELVETAELYGFNETPPLFDPRATAAIEPPQSTIPTDLTESVETGESAIGQGQVLATPLELASISQTVANRGVRLPTPIARSKGLRPDAEPVEVTSKETAATLRELMIGVVESGTGVAAALPGIQVAGKTGTAELGPTALAAGDELAEGEEPPQELDAWFTAFAPANDPKLAVAVMIVDSTGDGGEIAAPIAASGPRHRARRRVAAHAGPETGAQSDPTGKPIVAPMIASALPAIAAIPASVSAGSESSAIANPAVASSAPTAISHHQPPPRRSRSASVAHAPRTTTAKHAIRAAGGSRPAMTTIAATATPISVSWSTRSDTAGPCSYI